LWGETIQSKKTIVGPTARKKKYRVDFKKRIIPERKIIHGMTNSCGQK